MGRAVLGAATTVAGELIAISAAVAECVPARARSHVDVVHHGVDLRHFRPGPATPGVRAELGGDGDSVLVGILGRVDPSKRAEHVVRAVGRLDPVRTRVRLAVVGSAHLGTDDYVRALRQEAEQLLGHRVRFLPARDDVPEVMRALDIVVNASEAEPFGLTLIEAQASGVPVIAMRSGGAPEIVADGVSGYVVDVGDESALATAIERLAADVDLRTKMGLAARRYAEAAFDIRRQADRIVEIYRRTSRRKPASNSSAARR
jgi:glycosyltransferase involved in cell wall biosynthesis